MRFLIILIISSLMVVSCAKDEKPSVSSGNANFSKVVIIGDGYLGGYQDGALGRDGQEHSVGAIMMRSFSHVESESFYQALMPDNSGLGIAPKPWEGLYVTSSKMGDRIDCEGEASLGPVKTYHTAGSAQPFLDAYPAAILNDFTFPFAKTSDLLNVNFHLQNVYYNRVAASFGNTSIVNAVMSRQPTFFTAWLGLEDIYGYARNGGRFGTIPTPAAFSATLDSVLSNLTANGAKGVLATIPNLDVFPYYTLIPWNSADLTQEKADSVTQQYDQAGMTHIVFNEGKNGFVIEDPAAPFGYRQMIAGEYMTIQVPLDSMKCFYYGIFASVIHDRYVLDTAEVNFIQSRINDYNNVIIQKSIQYNLALVDMNEYFTKLKTGIYSNGVLFTNEFVSGGFFSLDGYYPTQRGAELIANKFILAINNKYQSTLPTIYCDDCNGVIFP